MPDKQPAPLITPQMLRDWQACYTDDSILELYNGRPHLTPLEICELRDVSVLSRLWVVLRPAIIPESELHQLGLRIVQDAAVAAAARQATDAALAVKRQWLAGCADDAALLAAHADVSRAAESAWQAHHFWLYGALSYDELLEQRDWFENETPYVNSNDRLYTVREAVLCATTNSCREASYTTSRVLSGLPVSRAKHLKMVGAMLRRLYHEPAA